MKFSKHRTRLWTRWLPAVIAGGLVVVQAADDPRCENFTTDPVANGRFTSLTMDTESVFRWSAASQQLEATLDVDAGPAYYLSAPLSPVTDAADSSFSARFRVEAFDDAYSPAAFIGLMTTTHVGAGGDGLAMVVSAANGKVVAHAAFEAGLAPSLAGDAIPLVTHRDYLAVARYRAAKRELAVEVFDGTGFTNLVGFSTKSLPPELHVRVDRLGLQNDGARRDVDPAVGSITLTVDDLCTPAEFPNRLSISPSVLSVTEGNTGSTTNAFTVSLSPRSSQVIAVDYLISSTNARSTGPNQDFAGPDGSLSGTLGFPANTATVPLTVTVFGDLVDETAETVTISLRNPEGGVLDSAAASATLTIENDDLPPTVTIATNSVVEGDAGTTPLDFVVTVSGATEKPAGFAYRTQDGQDRPATANVDYASLNTTLVLPADRMMTNQVLSTNLTVQVIGDLDDETVGALFTEDLYLVLDHPLNLRWPTDRARGWILDDDETRLISIQDAVPVFEGDPGQTNRAVFALTLREPSSQAVSVEYTTASGTASVGGPQADVRLNSGTKTFPPGVTHLTLEMEVVADLLPETNRKEFQVLLSNPSPAGVAGIGRSRATGTVIDDDPYPTLTVAGVTISERRNAGEVTNAVFVVNLSPPVPFEVSFDSATMDGTARAGSDYVGHAATNTFKPNTDRIEIPVKVLGDLVDEDDVQQFTLRLSNVRNALPAVLEAHGLIRDEDLPPELRVTGSNLAEGDSGSRTASLFVTLSAPSERAVRVTYRTEDRTARVADRDYQQANSTLSFDPGRTELPAPVIVYGDTQSELDEQFCVRLSDPVNATLAEPLACVTIQNDDPPVLSVAAVTVVEGNGGTTDAVFVVEASTPFDVPIEFRWGTVNGDAVAGTDFVGFTNEFRTMPANTTRLELPVPVIGDTLDEDDVEYFTLRLSDVRHALPSALEARGWIQDDDTPPTLSVQEVRVLEGNRGTTDAVFVVQCSRRPEVPVTFNARTVPGTAFEGSDFLGLTNSYTIPTNTTRLEIRVPVKGDVLDEDDLEYFTLRLSEIRAALPSVLEARGAIQDDDPLPAVRISGTNVVEGNSGTRSVPLPITLDPASGREVRVSYTTTDDTAKAARLDYESVSGMVVFKPGQTVTNVVVKVQGDLTYELDEQFWVLLSNPVHATNAEPRACVVITNDDVPPIVSLANLTVAESEGSVRFQVVLSHHSEVPVTFRYETSDGSAHSPQDYSAARSVLPLEFAWNESVKGVPVPVIADGVDEKEEFFTLRVTNVTTATPGTLEARCTIVDDDTATLRVEDAPKILEGNSGTRPADFSVVLTRATSEDVSFDYATVDGTARTNNNDYVLTGARTNIPKGSTVVSIPVPVRGDTNIEPDEVFYLAITNITGLPQDQVLRWSGEGTILDDDTPTVVLPAASPISVLEGDEGTRTNVVIPVLLSWAARADVVLRYRTRNGTATNGLDFDAVLNELRIPTGVQSTQAVVSVIGDNLVEGNETFDVVFSDPVNAILTNTTVNVTIVDDDDILRLVGVALAAEDCQPANGALDPFETVTLRVTVDNPGYLPLSDISLRLVGNSHVVPIEGTNRYGALPPHSQPVTRPFRFQVFGNCGEQIPLQFEASDAGRPVPMQNNPTHVTLGRKPDGTLACCVPVDLRLTAGGAPDPVTVDSDLVYTVRVANVGPNPATSVMLTSRLTQLLRLQTVAGAAGWTTNLDGSVACLLGALAPQAEVTVQLTASTPGLADVTSLPAYFASRFQVGSVESEQTPADNITDVLSQLVPPTGLSVSHVKVKEGDAGTATNAVFTVWRRPGGNASSVQWFTRDGTASGASDFVGVTTPQTISFAAGQTAYTNLVVRVIGDSVAEPDEAFEVVLTNPTGGLRINGPGVGTILDDDSVGFVLNRPTVLEGGVGDLPTLAFTVALSAPAKEAIEVRFVTADGTATVADSDYRSVTHDLRWAEGESLAQAVPVTVIGDQRHEADETVIAQVRDLSGRLLAETNGVILNDDRAVFIAGVTNVVEGGPGDTNHLVFVVALTSPSPQPVTCEFRTADGTATVADGDYLAVVTNLTFAPDTAGPLLVRVPVIGDARREFDETVVGYLINAFGADIDPARSRATNVIINDEGCLAWPVASGSAITAEGCRPANQAVDPFETVVVSFTLRNDGLAATTNLVATLLPETAEGYPVIPLTPTRDYGSLRVGESLSRSFTNRVEGPCGAPFHYRLLLEDRGACAEVVEFPLQLGAVRNGVTNCCSQADLAIGTNVPPSIPFGHEFRATVSAVNHGPAPAASVLLRIRLPNAGEWSCASPQGTCSRDGTLLTCNVDALGPGESAAVNLIGTALPPGTHPLSGIVAAGGDDPDGSNNYFSTTFSVEVCDGVSIYVDDGTVAEGGMAHVSVRLQPATNRVVTVFLRTADGTATAATGDFVPLPEPGRLLEFKPGMTVTTVLIPTLDDALDEPPPDEFFVVRLLSASGAPICATNAEARVYIKDNDPPCLSIGDVGVDVGLTGKAVASVPVWLSSEPGTNVTVNYATRDGTAVGGTDYEPKPAGTLAFGPTETNKTVSITISGNTVDEGTEYFFVDLTNAVNATYCKPTGIVTITNRPCALPPLVTIVAPTNNAAFPLNSDILIQAEASDPEPRGAVSAVAFRWDTNLLAIVTSPLSNGRWPVVWTNAPPGDHVLTAVATDNCGLSSTSAPVHVTVHGGCVPPPCGLVGWWSGENDFTDRVTGCQATKAGTGTIGFDTATVGQGLRFDGTTNLEMPDERAYDLTNLTIEAWIKSDGIGDANRMILCKGLNVLNATASYSLYVHGKVPNSIDEQGKMWGSDVPGVLSLLLFDGVSDQVFHARRVLPTGELVHVAATVGTAAGTNAVRFYVNGELDAEYPKELTPLVNNRPLQIGGLTASIPRNSFAGLIDELALYNRALEPQEIRAIYLAGSAGKCPQLPNCWPPTLAPVADLIMWEDTGASVPVQVGDDDYVTGRLRYCPDSGIHLVRTAASSWNETLIPTTNMVVSGTSTNRTLTLRPATNEFGAGWVLVTADDGDQTVGELFQVTVEPVNDPPTLDPLTELTLIEDAPEQTVTLTGISAGPANEKQGLTVTATSDNPALIPYLVVDYTSPQTTGRLRFRPAPDASGLARITVVVKDDCGTEHGGVDAATNVFTLAVRAVNDPPTLDPITNRTHRVNAPPETIRLTGITTGAANEAQTLFMSAGSDNPSLVEPRIAYSSPAATGTLSYQPKPGQSGVATITVTVKDDGGAANGGRDTVQRQFRVTIQSNLPPTVLLTAPTNGQGFAAPAAITLSATARDPDGWITAVTFYANTNTFLGNGVLDPAPADSYRFTWTGVPVGEYELTARATDNDGAQATSASVRVEVTGLPPTNLPPVVRLVEPVDGQLVARNQPLNLAAEASDPDGWVVGVEFYRVNGGQYLSITNVARERFQVEFHGVTEETNYVFVARATDNQGATAWSNAITNHAMGGDILIIRPAPDPEIEGLERHLREGFEIPSPTNIFSWYPPEVRVLDAHVVNPALAAGFRVLLWDDLGRPDVRVPENVVETLWHGWNQGVALYLIGERLAEAGTELSAPAARQWATLTGITSKPGRAGPGWIVRQDPVDRENELFDSNFPPGHSNPPVTDFCYPRSLPAGEVVGDGEVRADLGSTPVLIRYPRFDQPEDPLQGPRLVQRFLVAAAQPDSGDPAACNPAGLEDSLNQRQVLFRNAVFWLLGALCDDFRLALKDPDPSWVELQPCVPYRLVVELQNNGGCAAGGVIVTQDLPAGCQVVGAAIPGRPEARVVRTEGRVVFAVGQVPSTGLVSLHTWIVATRPGEFTSTYTMRARFKNDTSHQLSLSVAGAACECPRLEVLVDEQLARLRLRGTCPVSTVLEQSTNLVDWSPVQTQAALPDGQVILTLPTAPAERRFFRLVIPPLAAP